MDINIEITITNEGRDIEFDAQTLVALRDYLVEKFFDKHYGESVVKYFFGFELLRFDGGFAQFFNKDVESWKTSTKWMVTNARFDWDEFRNLSQVERIKLIGERFSNSISRISSMKRKPKNFDYLNFKKDFDVIMSNYINKLSKLSK